MLKCSKLMGIVYPKGVIPLQMPECFAASPPFFKRNDAKVPHGIPPKCIKVYRSVLNCILTYRNVSNCIDRIKLYRNVLKCTIVYRRLSLSEFIRVYRNLSEFIRINPINFDWFGLVPMNSASLLAP